MQHCKSTSTKFNELDLKKEEEIRMLKKDQLQHDPWTYPSLIKTEHINSPSLSWVPTSVPSLKSREAEFSCLGKIAAGNIKHEECRQQFYEHSSDT